MEPATTPSLDSEDGQSEEDVLREYIGRQYRAAQAPPLLVAPGTQTAARESSSSTEWKEAYDLFRKENATVADTLAVTARQTDENVCCFFHFEGEERERESESESYDMCCVVGRCTS